MAQQRDHGGRGKGESWGRDAPKCPSQRWQWHPKAHRSPGSQPPSLRFQRKTQFCTSEFNILSQRKDESEIKPNVFHEVFRPFRLTLDPFKCFIGYKTLPQRIQHHELTRSNAWLCTGAAGAPAPKLASPGASFLLWHHTERSRRTTSLCPQPSSSSDLLLSLHLCGELAELG